MFSSGRMPMRHPQVDLGPADQGHRQVRVARASSTGQAPARHDPADGTIVNWNNKPARGWQAADDNWAYGSVHRNDLLEARVDPCRRTRWRRTSAR